MYYLGVDAGGTKTIAVLADENANVIQTVKIGSGNVISLGPAKITALIKNLLGEFSSKCGPEDITASTFAMAGVGRKNERQLLESILKDNHLRNFHIMTDAAIMHYSIFGSGEGLLIIAGTGTVCLVRSNNGKLNQLGGIGYLLGDEGGGYYIGRQAIKKALNASDAGNEPSLLTKKILEFYNLHQPQEIVSKISLSEHPQKDIAAPAQVVCDWAQRNDAQAIEIINDAGKALVELTARAIKHYCPADAEVYNVALCGGLLFEGSVVERAFKQHIQNYNYKINYCSAKMSAAAAAVMYALTQDNIQITDEMMEKLKNIQI